MSHRYLEFRGYTVKNTDLCVRWDENNAHYIVIWYYLNAGFHFCDDIVPNPKFAWIWHFLARQYQHVRILFMVSQVWDILSSRLWIFISIMWSITHWRTWHVIKSTGIYDLIENIREAWSVVLLFQSCSNCCSMSLTIIDIDEFTKMVIFNSTCFKEWCRVSSLLSLLLLLFQTYSISLV